MAPCLSLIPFISTYALKSWYPPTSKHQPQRQTLKGALGKSFSSDACQQITRSSLSAFLGSGFAQTSSQII